MPGQALGTARHQNAMLVHRDDVPGTGHLQHMDDGRTRSTGAVLHNAHILDTLAHHLQGIEYTRQHDDGGAMLVVMEHRNLQFPFQFSLDFKTFRTADILQVDASESGGNRLDRSHHFLFGRSVQTDGERIHTAELFEEDALSLHDRQARLRADIAQAQYGGAVGNHRHRAAFEGVGVNGVRVGLDLAAGLGHAGGIGSRKRVFVLAGYQTLYGQFAGTFGVQFQRGLIIIHNVSPFPQLWVCVQGA